MENENEVLYDAEKELAESLKEDSSNDGKEIIYEAKDPAKIKEEKKEEIKEEPKTVFTNGIKPEFVLSHTCSRCYNSNKDVRQLTVRPSRFSLKRKTIGYISICANCGHVSFYATDANEFLAYLRGKRIKEKKPSLLKRIFKKKGA